MKTTRLNVEILDDRIVPTVSSLSEFEQRYSLWISDPTTVTLVPPPVDISYDPITMDPYNPIPGADVGELVDAYLCLIQQAQALMQELGEQTDALQEMYDQAQALFDALEGGGSATGGEAVIWGQINNLTQQMNNLNVEMVFTMNQINNLLGQASAIRAYLSYKNDQGLVPQPSLDQILNTPLPGSLIVPPLPPGVIIV